MATYYDILGVAPTASADEIKSAFRREIARYHPDKVQHLGQEFQEIAADKAAGLTQAYKTLSDESARVDYDAQLETGVVPPSPERPEPASQTEEPPARPEPTERPASEGASRRERSGAESSRDALPPGGAPGIRPVRRGAGAGL